MVRVLVEKIFDPPITEAKWNQDVKQAIPCHSSHNVHWIRSMMSRDRSRVICEFEAPDAETVRRSFRKVGLPFARVWTVEVLEPIVVDDAGTIGTKGWLVCDADLSLVAGSSPPPASDQSEKRRK